MQPTSALASVVIVSYNTREILRRCLHELEVAIGATPIDVWVVDNASADGSADMVASDFPAVRLLRSATNLGFAAANNLALERARGDYLVLLNPDTVIDAQALRLGLRRMQANPRVGLAGGRLRNRDGSDAPSARLFPSPLNDLLTLSGLAARFPRSRLCGRFDRGWADPAVAADVDWVPGAYAILRRAAVDEVGGFDERFFLYYEEVDLCRRLRRAGWRVSYWPEMVVEHLGGESARTVRSACFATSGSQLTLWRMRSALLYYRKHHGWLTAWLASRLELYWHRLRRLRAGLTSGDRLKIAESCAIERQLQAAWFETVAGRRSPPRPW